MEALGLKYSSRYYLAICMHLAYLRNRKVISRWESKVAYLIDNHANTCGTRALSHSVLMRFKASSRKSAYTLIELLVVLAIIGLLAGLLLSAVQMLRQSAAKAACQNLLHQQVLALQQYHDANHRFPTGHRSLFSRDLQPFSGWTL